MRKVYPRAIGELGRLCHLLADVFVDNGREI